MDRERLDSSGAVLKRVRKICLALAQGTERLSHGSPCFFIGTKNCFVMFMDNHHGDGRVAIWCAAPPGAQETLIAADPERFFRPPYVGHRGWIGMRLDRKPDWPLVQSIVTDAYDTMNAPKARRRSS